MVFEKQINKFYGKMKMCERAKTFYKIKDLVIVIDEKN
jgi:hypothetical protein